MRLTEIILQVLPDKCFIELKYFYKFHKFPNLKNPKTYNEKLQWIKLYDRKEEYILMCDKYEAKKLISKRFGEEYIVPTLGIYDNFCEINFDNLPNRFVIKCTHDSGSIVICKDKKQFDIDYAKKTINEALKDNYYWHSREWPYKYVKPRIIIEQYLEDKETKELRDYKVFAFDGVVKSIYISGNRQNKDAKTTADYFDENFNHLPLINKYDNANIVPKKPVNFEKMKSIASSLSKGYREMRVDFYEVDGKLYFGEITLFHGSGYDKFVPNEWDYTFGSWIKI